MSAQTSYNYKTSIGVAGGIADLEPHAIDTYLNEEETGTMVYGVGVVVGTEPGKTIALPTSASTSAEFVGITTNNRTTEYDLEGKIHIRQNYSIGVMRYGKIYVRVADDIEPAYGDTLYLVIDGEQAGYFTNASGDTAIEVKGKFIGGLDTSTQIAPVVLYNEAN